MNNFFSSEEKVKMDLFLRYGVIAAAGDRHLAEFCEGNWYLKDLEHIRAMHFSLTPVSWRKENLKDRLKKSKKLVNGELDFEIQPSGEEGLHQIRALLGLCDLVTNVNVPNKGQIPNLPLGAVVETNAVFRDGLLEPVFAGSLPQSIYPLVTRIVGEQEILARACANRDWKLAFQAFVNDPLVNLPLDQAKDLFIKMVQNTKKYLQEYDVESLNKEML